MKLLAIDGNSIMNRAFYGIKVLANSKGQFTNALTGFMNIFLKEIEEVKPDCVAVAFDLKIPTFRHKVNETYKANRKGMPEELAQQMPIIKELLQDMGIKIVECEGYEADDILGTLSKASDDSGNKCYILTGDRDSFQLVSENVTIHLTTTKGIKIYNPDRIMEEYGILPRQLIDVKALMGDNSDNISGVKGIGEKTALRLIKENNTLTNLYENLPELSLTNSLRVKLENGHQDAINSRFLAEICLEVPIEKNIEFYRIGKLDRNKTTKLLSELEMIKLINRLGLMRKYVENSKDDLEYNLSQYEIKVLSREVIYHFTEEKEVQFIFCENKIRVLDENIIYITDNEELILEFMNSSCKKQTFEGKTAYKFAFEHNTELKNLIFCCNLAGYLLNSHSSDYSIENLCLSYNVRYRSDMGENADICSINLLAEILKKQLDISEMNKLYYNIELPLCEVLASMEYYGVKVDNEGINIFGKQLKEQINLIISQIYDYAGEEFNINSTKQLGVVLFEKLGLPVKKKTKLGYSTNTDVLELLINKHPIIPLIIEYRTLTKLKSTYVDGFLKVIKHDGRIHTIFKQTETRTGRISSIEPNIQNIPVRKKIGRNMRKFFIADENYILIDADYSQIELRILASICNDENMQNAFRIGKDIHISTATQVFGISEDFVTPEMRNVAKSVNFGIIYGISAFSLSKDINISVVEAKKYIQKYLDNFPNVSKYMDEVVENGIKNGYVTTIFGRRRYIPELYTKNKILQAFGKRVAMNAPIQGTAADIIKIAMIKVYNRIKEENLNARIILQIHDELIIESTIEDKDKVTRLLKEEMENAVNLAVPLIVDIHEGKSWFIAK